MGRGDAFRLASPALGQLRNELSGAFSSWLTRQDQALFQPHIAIQNKAEPDEARLLLEQMQLEFEPFQIFAEGLLLWRYLGGPWAMVDVSSSIQRLPLSA